MSDLYTQVSEARSRLIPFLAIARTHPDRLQVDRAILEGAAAFDQGVRSSANAYPADSAEAAAWLCGWWRRSREDE